MATKKKAQQQSEEVTEKVTSPATSNNRDFEEWKCEIKINRDKEGKETTREAEKLKKIRPCVKITEQEAETLNDAALNSPRHDHVVMYFLPE